MNPAANAGVSGGLAGAIVTIINSWFVALHFAAMTPDVASAYMVVLTALFGYFFHMRSLVANDNAPAKPAASAPAEAPKAAA